MIEPILSLNFEEFCIFKEFRNIYFYIGSGKTLVAAHIVQHYLETCGNLNKSVLFFTPGSALAQQQSKRLANFLPNEFKSVYF